MLKLLKLWHSIIGRKIYKQTTFCWCECGNELCSSDSLVKDTDFVYYKCSNCGIESKWNFDAPCPIKLSTYK